MSTYASILIQGEKFCCTHDGYPENILEGVKQYVDRARKVAKPGYIPEVTISLILADTHNYYSFFHLGFTKWGKTYEVKIGPRGGLKIKEVK